MSTEASPSYYRARYYDPTTERFISEDPKDQGSLYDNPNLYEYVENNPANWIDPLGLYTLDPHQKMPPLPPSPEIDKLLKCIESKTGLNLVVTSTSENTPVHPPGKPHRRGVAVDNNGNTLTKVMGSNTTTYGWDFENRLTSVTLPGSGGTVSFKYDPFGRRIYKSSSSGISVYAYDGDNLIEETNSSGVAIARYSQTLDTMDEPLAMLRSGATSYYHADGLGSVTSLSNVPGGLAQTYGYDSFGKQTSSSGSLTNPFQYTARELDPETSLYFYRARYYDQNSGRFLSEDPIGFSSGTYNFYAYVSDDPVNFDDPSGNKKIHGNWCGPNWTGGQNDIFIPSNDVPGFYKPPIDYVDKVCSYHDRCFSKCRAKHPCSPWGRRVCGRKCDFFLVGRLVTNPKDVYAPWAYIVGLGIGLGDMIPPAGTNGGAEPTQPVKCCKGGPPPAGAGAH